MTDLNLNVKIQVSQAIQKGLENILPGVLLEIVSDYACNFSDVMQFRERLTSWITIERRTDRLLTDRWFRYAALNFIWDNAETIWASTRHKVSFGISDGRAVLMTDKQARWECTDPNNISGAFFPVSVASKNVPKTLEVLTF